MKDILSIMQQADKAVFGGSKIPHGLSHPVIRVEDGKYVLSAFAYVFNKDNVDNNTLYRPTRWITMDIESGEIISVKSCETEDFSSAPFGKLFSLKDREEVAVSQEKIKELYDMIESIRTAYVEDGANILPDVIKYLGEICLVTPKEYRRFYKELVNV